VERLVPFRVTVIGIKKREPGWWQVAGLCSSIIDGEPRARCARRQRAKVQAIAQELRYRRELPIAEQGAWLQSVLRDIYGYHAVPGNLRSLGSLRLEITKRWYRSLCHRSHKRRLD